LLSAVPYTIFLFIFSFLQNTEYIQRLDYALLYFLAFMSAAFIENINPGKVSKPTAVYGVVCAVLAVGQWLFSIWFAYELLSVWQMVSIIFFLYFIGYDLLWRFYNGAVDMSRDADAKPGLGSAFYRYLTKTEFGNICILVLILALTGLIDIFSTVYFSVNTSLSRFGILGVVLCMTYILARKSPPRLEATANEVINAGLTAEEIKVAMLMMEGTSHRDIARKLHMNAEDLEQHETAIRHKLDLKIESGEISHAVIGKYKLTKRETEILKYLRDDFSTDDISAELYIAEETVRVHVRNLLKKLNLENRQDVPAWIKNESENK
jgi:DNA-binding NarL/FixJ family response regulator